MAAGFYSAEEVQSKLGKSEEEIRDLVREGRLREFRDAGKLIYKKDDVDAYAAEMGQQSEKGEQGPGPAEDSVLGNLSLEPSDSAAGDAGLSGSSIPLSLDDSQSGGTSPSDASAAALEMLSGDTGGGESGTSIPLEPFDESGADLSAGGTSGKSDTGGKSDSGTDDQGTIPLSGSSLLGQAEGGTSGTEVPLDLSGDSASASLGESGTAVPLDLSDESGSGSGTGGTGTSVFTLEESEADVGEESEDKKGDTVISAVGINVFDDEELEIDSDPQSKTSVSDATEESLEAEAMGSGSGLLDLTRESDDTSLGADLWEEVQPGGGAGDSSGIALEDDTKAGLVEDTGIGERFAAPAAAGPAMAPAQMAVHVEDPLSGMVTGLLGVGLLVMLVGGLVSVSIIRGVWPSPLETIHQNFTMFVGGSAALAVLVALIGLLMGRPRRVKPKG